MLSHSRQETVCGHCGLKMIRHNLKVHTETAHKGLKIKERPVKMKPLNVLFQPANKKPRTEEVETVDPQLEEDFSVEEPLTIIVIMSEI